MLVFLGFAKGNNLTISTQSHSFSYEQQICIGADNANLFFPGNTTAFPGYIVCGIEQTELYWSDWYYSTYTQYLIPVEQSDKIEYIYSNTEYSVGSSIEGRTILARSVAFNLPFTPSASTLGIQADNFFHYSPQGIVKTIGDFYYAGSGGALAEETLVEDAFIYMYCVEKLSGQCGESAYWEYNSQNHEITISGEGAVYEYTTYEVPWYDITEYIQSVVIQEGITSIGTDAFYQCMNLDNITLPNSLTTIGSMAFATCTSLKHIYIPAGVASIGQSAFSGSHSLESIVVDSENPYYNSNGDCNAIIETATNTLILGCKNTVIPNSVTKIGVHAFTQYGHGPIAAGGPTSLTIPTGVTEIGDYVFAHCRQLTTVILPETLTHIGKNAFYGCTALESIVSHIAAEDLFEVDANIFNEVNGTLYVPAGAKETYASTNGWSQFENIVELEAFGLTVSAAKYATLYLDYNAIIPEGVEVYTASTVDGNRLMMQQITGILPANTGVIVKAEQGTYTFEQSFEKTVAIENNLFRGSVEDEYITPAKGAKYYVLSMKNGVVGMYEDALSGGTFKNNANKAYLVLGEKNLGIYDEEVDTEDPGMQLSNSYYFDFGTTGIDAVVTECEENVYYDLSGRRVENPTRGIYIVNGKKRLVK